MGPYGPQPGPGPNPDWAPTRARADPSGEGETLQKKKSSFFLKLTQGVKDLSSGLGPGPGWGPYGPIGTLVGL